jgi:hypothetical protein
VICLNASKWTTNKNKTSFAIWMPQSRNLIELDVCIRAAFFINLFLFFTFYFFYLFIDLFIYLFLYFLILCSHTPSYLILCTLMHEL